MPFDDDDDEKQLRWDDWHDAVQIAHASLLTTSTTARVRFLDDELARVVDQDLSLAQALDVFKLLTETYPRYIDTPSRDAVLRIGTRLVRKDLPGVLDHVLGWLANEVAHKSASCAAPDLFVLLTWSCAIYAIVATTPDALVGVFATLLDLLLSARSKSSMQKSALVRTRRALRSAPHRLDQLMSTLVALAKSSTTPLVYLALLGTAVDVAIRLQDVVIHPSTKDAILNLYTTSVVMSKSTVPPHALNALHDFVQTTVGPDDLASTILPIMEKALLRSPEYSLAVIAHFLTAYTHPVDAPILKKFLAAALNSAKSSNPVVRTNACALFHTLASKSSPEFIDAAVSDVLALPLAVKTTGIDHRVALYTMLTTVPTHDAASMTLVNALPTLLLKEVNSNATTLLVRTLPVHLCHLLVSGAPIPPDVTALIAREVSSSAKPALRRAYVSVVGSALWDIREDAINDAIKAFMNAVAGALVGCVKTVSANPLGAPAGPLEGYVGLAVLLGPLSTAFKDDAALPSTDVLMGTPTKPSFLLWDKVYHKLGDPEEARWLLRAAHLAIPKLASELSKPQSFVRTALGNVFVHFGQSAWTDIRRATIQTLADAVTQRPQLINDVVCDALRATLTVKIASKPVAVVAEDEEKPASGDRQRQDQYASLVRACANLARLETREREEICVRWIVLAHHGAVCGTSNMLWIDLCQRAGTDPHAVVSGHVDEAFRLALEASMSDPKMGFADASYRAIGTLALIAPEIVLPRVIEQLRKDVDVGAIDALTDETLGMWETAEGHLFVDVLATKKDETPKKGKGADMARFDADVRQAVASKKIKSGTAASSLGTGMSKETRALVEAQLAKEAEVRRRVDELRTRIVRGLAICRAVVESVGGQGGSEETMWVVDMAECVLRTTGRTCVRLVAGRDRNHAGDQDRTQGPYETFIALTQCCSERLQGMRRWLGVAALRALEVGCVPESDAAEDLASLVLRVLYRLRTLSEQAPFDAPTFAFAFLLLGRVADVGGVGIEREAQDEDAALEQVKLVLDVIMFHRGEFSHVSYPRRHALECVLHVIRTQPRLSKDASSVLVDVAEAMQGNASRDEVNVLIKGTLVQETHVRNACLQALQPFDLTELDWLPELWVACHDADEQNARLAARVWEDNGLDVDLAFGRDMLGLLGHENAYVRTSAAAALADAVEHHPDQGDETIEALQTLYRDKAKMLAPEFDQFGMVISETIDRADPWPTRVAIALTLAHLAPTFPPTRVEPFFTFLVRDEALGDRSPDVRREMLRAGAVVIDHHGARHLAGLLSTFETHLAGPSPANETGDQIKEAVVILFGRVARHLAPSDPRIPGIVDRLQEALQTPAEQVQMAVSDCLVPLAALMGPDRTGQLVDRLFGTLFGAPTYAARRGAAYGLAGAIKGLGIGAMKRYDVIERLRVAAEDKKRFELRQGAMFALETLSATLGRLFEPYITFMLPLLLTAFGDATTDVREAAQDAARVVMGNMSGYGVKLILPSLLAGLDEKQWRSKKGSIELLGMMAYCSPRQLSLSLPIVIPRLTGVLTDTHAQVKASANKSLKQFGEVISNPEIRALVPALLKALVDPGKTTVALTGLLKTSFVHYIDHSSLALVIPIIERGLRERGAEGKKKAAQIVGNLASLTDAKDFVPYLSSLLPMVHLVLVDPVPEARATAAKTLGTLVERLGEDHFPDLVPSLLRTLKTETSGVDRQGAAQGLSEVLSGLGMDRLEGLLPDIIANAQSPRSTVREGFMSLLVYLPATFGNRFQPHLPKIIAPILSGLADTEEYVREAAMRAGRMMVTNYATRAIDLLLPELEEGMFDPGWRIRQSSITLVGELLFKVSGITSKPEMGDDEDVAEAAVAETSRRALIEVLGAQRRDRILSVLYIARQDAVNVVRQSSIHIWKALVHNTPRTVREILHELVRQLVKLCWSDEFEQQETATRTTAELCRKFGEKILGEIIPILQRTVGSPDARTRQGVCLMLSDIMENTTDTQREGHETEIITIVRTSLVDDDATVRAAAAKAFDTLQEHVGPKAIDQTIPTLLEALRQPGESSGTALRALREVMSVRAATVFPVLIPTLIATPMTVFNARALASLVTVAGNALSKRLTVILNALVRALEEEKDEELLEALDEALRALLGSIEDPEGLNTLMLLLLGWTKGDAPTRRTSACNLFEVFCGTSELDSSLYRVDWVRQLVSLLDDSDVGVHTAALKAFDTFVKSVPKDELEPLVVPLRRTIEGTGALGRTVPGFDLPKGVAPAVPIIIAGLTTGSNEQRENAAYAIGDLVERTDEASIKPFVVPFTGPLIRVATQATTYPPGVKTAILSALTTMLARIPNHVKPFFPQLQRTFVKSVSDGSSIIVRTRAADALGVLMRSQPRVDPVVTELVGGARASEEEIAASYVLALARVVESAVLHGGVGDKVRETCVELAHEAFRAAHEDHYIQAMASLVASLSTDPQSLKSVVDAYLVSGTPPSALASHTILAVLSPEDERILAASETVFAKLGVLRSVALKVKESAVNERPAVARPARDAREILKAMAADGEESLSGVF